MFFDSLYLNIFKIADLFSLMYILFSRLHLFIIYKDSLISYSVMTTIAMSSAQVGIVSDITWRLSIKSFIYKLNNIGLKIPPYITP